MGNKINFLGIEKQYKSIKKEIDFAINRVLYKGIFIGGEEVEKFEKEIANFLSAKYAISVNSGTDALFLSLKALGIKEGDEVITSPFTFIATIEAVVNLGAKPVFIDINPKTFNIDPDKIEEKITKNTKAIIPVHLFGKLADMKKIINIAKKHNIYIVEDSAQSIGAGKISGDLSCFSFFPSKNLGAFGDGGLILTNNKKLNLKLRLLKNHGSSPKEKYLNLMIGMNSRLDSIQAAVLRVKLKYLLKWNKERINKAKYYSENLKEIKEIITPELLMKDNVFNQYTIRAKKRNELKKHLEKNNILTKIYYPLPLHLQPAFKYLGYKKGDFPISECASKEVLSLPIYPELKKEEQDYIIKKIKEFYEKKN